MNELTPEETKRLEKMMNRPICADCRIVLKKIPPRTVDVVWSDLPYNKGYNYDVYDDNKTETAYWDFLDKVFDEVERVTKFSSSIYIKQDMDNIFPMMKTLNRFAKFRNLIIWRAPSQAQVSDNYGKAYEIILFYTRGNPTFNEYAETRKSRDAVPQDSVLRKKEFRGKMDNLWDDILRLTGGCICSKESIIEKDSGAKIHPAQHPEALVKRSLLFSSNEEDLVLDMFAGSFTVAAVCKKLKRNFIACDISEKYVEVGKKRLADIEESMRQGSLIDIPKKSEKDKHQQVNLLKDREEKGD